MVPFDKNQNFVGRNSELEQLENIFAPGHHQKVAVTGLGGIWKTNIAIEAAYRLKMKVPDCATFWIPALSAETIHQAYLKIAQGLKLEIHANNDGDEVKKLVQEHLSQERAGRWLLIFDNADDLDIWIGTGKEKSPKLKAFLPRSSKGCIIFTTRNHKLAVKLAAKNVIQVTEMDESTAREFLRISLIEQDIVRNEPRATKTLLEQLTYLPLAIIQAAAYLNENQMAISKYLALLNEQSAGLISVLFEDEGRYPGSINPIAATWLTSFSQIQKRDPLAVDYLSFASCVDPRDIPLSMIPPGDSRKSQAEALGLLKAYSFIFERMIDSPVLFRYCSKQIRTREAIYVPSIGTFSHKESAEY